MSELYKDTELFAWIGEDELGSGEVGLKQALVPAGYVPLVATRPTKVDRDFIRASLQAQADKFGKTIRLVRFVYAETIATIEPVEATDHGHGG